MHYPEAVQFLYSLGNELKTAKLGLERITTLLEALGSPHQQGHFVHVAGTNGKGSTCAMLQSALQAGRRTGLYTSPHLQEPTERIQLNGTPVSEQQFAGAFAEVHRVAEKLLASGEIDLHPTYFETVTAMAFVIFAREAEWIVLETGLGGRLDATNVVTPELSVITQVDFDHENFLGNTLQSIAREKAGILKPGVPAVISVQRPEAEQEIERHSTLLHHTAEWPVQNLVLEKWGSQFDLPGLHIECPLAGAHQVENARTAAMALHQLGIAPSVIQAGIGAARWPGRLERVAQNPDVILDGAHNPAGARALAAYVKQFFPAERKCLIYGTMRDKSVDEVLDVLFPLFQQVIVTAPHQARSLSPETVLHMADHPNISAAEDLSAAVKGINSSTETVFVSGSLYLVAEARQFWKQ